MSASLNALRSRYDRIAIPTIQVAFALSLMLHAVLLSGWLPKVTLRPSEKLGEGKAEGSLAVRLAPPPAAAPVPPPAPMAQAPTAPARSAAAPKARRQPPSVERVLALERPSPSRSNPPVEAVRPPAETAPASANADFAAFIEARRHARESAPAPRGGPPVPPVETAQERDNRIAAINLGLNRTPSFGDEKKHGGGIFQVERVGFNDAEFFFFGWNKAIRRNSRQMIEVRRSDNATTELAVVRRMIAIIREHERGDFVWESRRLGRDVWLSARSTDNAGLEAFMMHEFFPGIRPRN